METSFDTAVAMLFFVRDDTFSKVFDLIFNAQLSQNVEFALFILKIS